MDMNRLFELDDEYSDILCGYEQKIEEAKLYLHQLRDKLKNRLIDDLDTNYFGFNRSFYIYRNENSLLMVTWGENETYLSRLLSYLTENETISYTEFKKLLC